MATVPFLQGKTIMQQTARKAISDEEAIATLFPDYIPAGTDSGQDKPVQPQDSRVIQFPTVGKYTDACDDLDSARFAKAVAAHVSQHFPGTLYPAPVSPERKVVHPDDTAVAQVAHDLGFAPVPVSHQRVEDKNQAVPYLFKPVRVVVGQDGEPWFVARDVCAVLGVKNTSQAVASLDPDERGICNTYTPSGPQEMLIISESGLYQLVFTSRKPEAKEFTRWVKREVLPAIAKHGAYMTVEVLEQAILSPDFVIGLATKLKEERARSAALAIAKARLAEENTELAFEKQALTAENSVLKPKADMHDSLMEADGAIDMGQAAKVLCEDFPGVGRNRLFRFLRWYGVLMYDIKQKNIPTQRYMNAGYFRVVVKGGFRYGSKYVQSQTFVKPEGMKFLHNLLNKFYDGNTIRYLPNKAA
jgi:prophage antirepressor-like protein